MEDIRWREAAKGALQTRAVHQHKELEHNSFVGRRHNSVAREAREALVAAVKGHGRSLMRCLRAARRIRKRLELRCLSFAAVGKDHAARWRHASALAAARRDARRGVG